MIVGSNSKKLLVIARLHGQPHEHQQWHDMHYPAGHWGWLWLLSAAALMPYAAAWPLTNGDLSSKENWGFVWFLQMLVEQFSRRQDKYTFG